jgi:ABC-type uncharacterized transport system involved in gliding motility auxiliary subunit
MGKELFGRIGILLGIVALGVSGVTAYLLPHLPLAWQISGGLGLVLVGAALLAQRKELGEVFSKKTTRYGLNSIAMSIMALAIVVVINLIANEYDVKKDVTKNKLHTLHDQSVKVLKGLTSEVRLRAFVFPNAMPEYQNVFDKYAYHTKLLKTDFIDPDKDPTILKQYAIKSAGTLIIESNTRTARIENLAGPDDPKIEEKITNAIIQVAKGEKKKIYFISGHGERLTSTTSSEGYSELKEILEAGRYKVDELILYEKGEVPNDAELLVCAGPKSDFLEPELKALESFLRGGGKMLFMMEYDSTSTLKGLLDKFGIAWQKNKTVLELNPLQQLARGNPLTPIVVSYDSSHDITRDMKQPTLFPITTPVEKTKETPKDIHLTSLFSSSPRSFEVQFVGNKVVANQNTDRKGPLSLGIAAWGTFSKNGKDEKPTENEKKAQSDAAAKSDDTNKTVTTADDKKTDDKKDSEGAEKKDREFRLVVIGDADFASNGARGFGLNSDLFQNTLSWLSKEEDLISIRPRSLDTSEFEITEQRTRYILLASVVGAPLLMGIMGIAVWLARRRR